MPSEPKPPYKLTIKLSGARPERIAEALNALQECVSDHDQTGDTSSTAVIECWKEENARSVADAFEDWLYQHALGLDSDMVFHRPGVRPETIAQRLREKHQTPMDREWQDFADKNGASVSGTILGQRINVSPSTPPVDE